jgi:hypothetical protein
MVADDQARGGHASGSLPAPRASKITPDSLEEFRRKLSTGAEETVDPKTWSGSLPNQWGTAPMLRVGRSKWFNLLWLAPIGFGLLIIGVVVAQALREVPAVHGATTEVLPQDLLFVEKQPVAAGSTPPPQ